MLDIHSLLAGFGTFIEYNEIDARWVAKIAAAFRHAGGDGSIKTLPDAAIHASLKAAGLLGGRAVGHLRRPGRLRHAADHRLRQRPGQHRQRQLRRARGRPRPSTACSRGLRFARMYNSRSEHAGAFGPGWSSWADARLIARADGAEYVGPDGQRALFPRMGDGYGRVLGRQRARRAAARRAGAALVRRRALGVRRGRPARAHHARARAPTFGSRTRTGAWPSCATPAAARVRVHWDDERIDGARGLRRPHRRATATRTGDLVEADGARARAATRSATPAACCRSPTPTASSRSPTPTTSRAA